MMAYVVKLEQFEGPLDLLLYLIQREEMDIYDIQIARITDSYLRHIEEMDRLDLDPAGDFLVMAATLLRIKARMLLPIQPAGEEGEEDPRRELVERLVEYKKFKEAARRLEQHESDRQLSYTRPLDESLVEEARKAGDEETFDVSLSQLVKALQGVLGRFETVVTHEVQLEPVSIEDQVALLQERLERRGRLSFSELFEGARSRIEVIVTFMALLELIKGGALSVHQADSFSELWIFPRRDDPDAAARIAPPGAARRDVPSAPSAAAHMGEPPVLKTDASRNDVVREEEA
ncbi:MAG: segregation/condensation protein A [Candidatus Latescibacterota bacterium]|nr:MAG: segregation/condensation protein A [Candidatus Latescibacterota bacterium]